MEVDDDLRQAGGDRGERVDVLRPGDPAPGAEPRARLHGEQVGVLDHPDELARAR